MLFRENILPLQFRIRNLKTNVMTIHKAGYKLLLKIAAALVILNAVVIYVLGNTVTTHVVWVASLVVYILIVNFFRSPNRIVLLDDNTILAPADGKIDMVFDTLHAVSMVTDYGAEVLIHVGLDTVKMNGEGFKGHVKSGDHVKKGDLLLELDLEKVKAAGYDTITPMIVCNTPDYASVEALAGKEVAVGDDVAVLKKH